MDTFDRLNLTKMQGIAEWPERLVLKLDRLTVRMAPVHDFGRIEAESLKRLMGGGLPLVLDGSIAQVKHTAASDEHDSMRVSSYSTSACLRASGA
jgi:hypothetical protein